MDLGAREALQRLMAAEHRLHEQMRRQEQLAERWAARSELAVRRGENQLASEALARKAEHEGRARELRHQYLEHGDAVRHAKTKLTAQGSVPRGLGSAPAAAARPAAEVQLDQLVREDRLERDLEELKQRLTAKR